MGSDEMKSREHLQASVDILNAELRDEAVTFLLEELGVDLEEDTEDVRNHVEDILDEVMMKAVIQGDVNDRGKGVGKRPHSGVEPDLLAGMAEPLLRDHDLTPGVLLEASGGREKEED